jgi:hypothetical protein
MMVLFLIILCFSSPIRATPVTADRITGLAYGNSPEQARRMALSQIVYQINQKISYNRCQRSAAGTKTVDCTSLAYHFDFPLEDIRYQSIPAEPGKSGQRATLSREAVISQFQDRLPRLKQQIVTALSREQHSADSLQATWQARDALTGYSEILELFGVPTNSALDDSQLQALAELEMASAQTLASLDQLPDYVLALGDVQNAFIHAPVPEGSVEMTPFSERVRRTLSQELAARFPEADIKVRGIASRGLVRVRPCYDPVRKLEKKCASGAEPDAGEGTPGAYTLLLGKYTRKTDSVLLQYRLLDSETGKAKTVFLKIPDRLLAGIRTTPIHRAFDQQLHQNILGDEEFQVQVESSRGNRNILIYEKENISLKLRASQSAWFYIVGHVIHMNQQYSYLVELDPRNATFVGRIGADQVNRWVEIGEFTIEPPLGVEHLQLVAASYDLSDSLPPTRWDEKLGYHVIRGSENDALAGLQTVRGLQRVCSAATTRGLQRNCASQATITTDSAQPAVNETALYEHESVLSYTSLPVESTASTKP